MSSIIELLTEYRSRCIQEEVSAVEQMLYFASSEPDCFKRSHLDGHFTGSCWILNEAMNKCLLTHHRKLDSWMQLGGHADGNPILSEVALQEAREESGLENITLLSNIIFDVDIHKIPAFKEIPPHLHYDVRFLFMASEDTPFIVSSESKDLAWVPLKDVLKYSSERSVLRMKEKSFFLFPVHS